MSVNILKVLAVSLPALFSTYASAEDLNVLYSNAYILKKPMEEIVKGFEAAHPGTTIHLSDVKGYADMTQLMLRAAITGGVPDVAFQGTSFLQVFVDRGLAVPLDDFINSESDWKNFGYSNSITKIGQVNGKTYGIPFAISIPTVYFNGDLVKAAGGDPQNLPKTWDGILELAKKIQAPSGGIYFDYAPTGNWTFLSLIQAAGGGMMTPDMKKIAFNGREGMDALKLLKAIGEAGMKDMSRDQAKQAFAAGSIGIFVTSSSDITSYTEQAAGRFPLIVSQFPVPSENGTLPAGGNAIMIHTKNASKQKLAWEFIKYATNPESQTAMVKAASYIPVNERAVQDAELLGNYYRDNPNLRIPVSQLAQLSGFFSFPGENSTKITKAIKDQLQAVITLKRSPEDAMLQMASEVEALLPKE
ncbi:ABC transporter substrate-binding protein [Phyllobacterium zundukense]|uniref:ABC transporter substrate-binding protein n=1 Tax=Phyllobacterium zundukense TaxID=1867719 RepID=A0A2N9VYT8_9HYPH|nr:ABC transporter substrate-binding protein [Phyllobacterium zundukense]ATU95238.1 ABC transporter substrate-binding protein [Phyllobacterium zundukense]PIO44656.1 ABC transporter substrate-binding protein [Phyllobacterium zundukense]